MSRFESIQCTDGIPDIDSSVVAIDFMLVSEKDELQSIEKFTFLPKLHNDDINDEVLPEGVREHPDVRNILFGILIGKGGVDNYTSTKPNNHNHIESMHAEQSSGHTYIYKLKRAEAEFGIGNSQPGYLVIGADGISFYPKKTHPKAEATAVISGAVLALGGVYAVLRRKHHGK